MPGGPAAAQGPSAARSRADRQGQGTLSGRCLWRSGSPRPRKPGRRAARSPSN